MSSGDAVTRYKQELKGAALRVTNGRVAVLRALESFPHSTAERVFEAVYLVLNDLSRAGLIRRFEPAGSAALYERRIGDNHHHLVCESCGTVQDMDCVVGQAPCLTPSDGEGFRVREAEVTFWGLCARCQARDQAAARQP
jgi:Fe2+ or Zn2+ uptake regulation protein